MRTEFPINHRTDALNFSAWLRVELHQRFARHGTVITDARFFRVSSSQPSIFIANLAAGLLGSAATHPDVALAKDVGGLIVERTLEGANARAAHGTVDIRVGMLEGGGDAKRLVGYATVFGSTLFVYLLASAAKGDLVDHEHPEDRGNAATEVARAVMRVASTFGQSNDTAYRLRCHFTDETRAARSRAQAAKLTATAKQHSVLLVLRSTEWDIKKVSDQQVIDQLLGMAATERDFVVQRVVRGKAALLISHRLPEPLGPNVPFTHGPRTDARTDEQGRMLTVVDDHWPMPMPDSGLVLTKLVRFILELADTATKAGGFLRWRSVAQKASEEFGLVSCSPEHHGRDVPLHSLQDPGTALKRMLDHRYRVAWRTGRLGWTTELATEIEGLTDQLETLEVLANGNRRVLAWVDCPVPSGLELTDDEWTRLDSVLAKCGRAGKPPSGWERPLRGQDAVVDNTQQSIQLQQGGLYRLEERPLHRSTDDKGRPRGWARTAEERTAQDTSILVSVNAARLHAEIGADLGRLASELEDQIAALEVPPLDWKPSLDARSQVDLLGQLAEVDRRISEAKTLINGAKSERYRFAALGDEVMREDALADEVRFRHLLSDAQADRERIELLRQPTLTAPIVPEAHAGAALSTLEELAAALQLKWSSNGTVPPEVTAAARRVLRRSLRLGVAPSAELAEWEVTVHVPLKDGRSGTFVRTGTVGTSNRQASANRNGAAAAERYLWNGDTYEAIGSAFGIDGSGNKNSFLLHLLKTWLGEPRVVDGTNLCVMAVDRRRALLDAPLEARRTVYAALTGKSVELIREGTDREYVDLMRSTYVGSTEPWSESWTTGSFVLQRRLLALILDQEDPSEGVFVLDAVRALGCSYESLVALAGVRGGIPPAVRRNWERTGSTPVEERRFLAVGCPWEDCPGRHKGRSGRSIPLATHFLHVPEIPGGLLCPTCRRVPQVGVPFAAAQFPAGYLLPRRRRTKEEDGTRIGTRLESAAWVARTVTPVA